MYRSLCITVLASFAVFCLAAPAVAQKKSAGGSVRAIQLECFKAQGAHYDASTKRWVMQGTSLNMVSRTDAVNRCVAEKTGKPATQFMRHETRYR